MKETLHQAIARLPAIMADEPPETESAKRRPQERQYNREYHQWQRDIIEWMRLTRDMLDPKALPRLKQWTGQDIKPNLQNYNLAVLAAATLSELARNNPGALAWWMIRREAYNDIAERRQTHIPTPAARSRPGAPRPGIRAKSYPKSGKSSGRPEAPNGKPSPPSPQPT